MPFPYPFDVLPAVVFLAEEAGRMLSAEFTRPDGPRGGGSHAEVDDEIEAFLRERLLAVLPATWLGEETGALHGPGPYCWLVDPQDGTSDFLAGERGSAVSVGLLRDGVPVLGVVHAPLPPDRGPDTIAWAEGMEGVSRDGTILQQTRRHPLRKGDIVFSSRAAEHYPLGNALVSAPARYIAIPSIAYRLARVAAGDGVAGTSLNGPCGWDYGAGHALLRGAGCVLVDESGQRVTYTAAGQSNVVNCFGGGSEAVAELAKRDWRAVRQEPKRKRRTMLTWPRVADDTALDRAVGCLFGQVAGDSLGSLVEFEAPQAIAMSYPEGVRNLADGGTWDTIAGQPTDDSELALDLARTLAVSPEWSAEAVAHAYGNWRRSRPFDIGTTTHTALSAAAAATPGGKAAAAREAANRGSQANGALMRCAPIGLWARDVTEAARAAREDASLSHPHPVCQAASAAFVAAIWTAVDGGDANAMLRAALAVVTEPEDAPVRLTLEAASLGEGPTDFMTNQGWVLLALGNAFRHLVLGTSLEEAVVQTVGSGGDTDTNGAIVGALLGARSGRAAIPVRWRMQILACRPLAEAGDNQPRPQRYWPDDVAALAEALLVRRSSSPV